MADLNKRGIVTKVRTLKTGETVGGIAFTRGPRTSNQTIMSGQL